MFEHILATDPDASGPLGNCAACGATCRVHVHAAEGWICRRCYLSASTVIEIRWINGSKFTRCLKGLKTKTPTAATAGAFRKE